jgi:hypothetical protein
MKYYHRVTLSKDNLELAESVANAIAFFQNEYEDGLNDLKPSGLVTGLAKKLPGLMSFRYGQSQELQGILDHLSMRSDKMTKERARDYQDKKVRSATDRQAIQMAEIEDDVMFIRELANEVRIILGQIQGLTKGLEAMHFQVTNLTKLLVAGMDTAVL